MDRFTTWLAIALAALVAAAAPLAAPSAMAAPQDCVRPEVILWGDGRHDDTAALAAWLRGADASWAATGKPVGARISGHSFRLSAAIYVSAGSRRQLEDFRLVWPERGEIVSGGSILTGADPEQAPVISGVSIAGGDAGEGVPFELPEAEPAPDARQSSCAIS